MHLLRLGKGIEFSDESIAIFEGRFGEMIDEGFDPIAAGFSQLCGAAELGGILLHQVESRWC